MVESYNAGSLRSCLTPIKTGRSDIYQSGDKTGELNNAALAISYAERPISPKLVATMFAYHCVFRCKCCELQRLCMQLGYIIQVTDKSERISWLSYAWYKCRRVVRIVLGRETYTIADYFVLLIF